MTPGITDSYFFRIYIYFLFASRTDGFVSVDQVLSDKTGMEMFSAAIISLKLKVY